MSKTHPKSFMVEIARTHYDELRRKAALAGVLQDALRRAATDVRHYHDSDHAYKFCKLSPCIEISSALEKAKEILGE